MIFFYQIFISLLNFSIHVASLFNTKAGLFVAGRKNIFSELNKKLSELRTSGTQLIWFHCSSLGEFEQARVLIEKFKGPGARCQVLITFFSPSGYEIRKNYDGADFIFYLPVDTKSNVKKFLDIVKPSQVFFVKYDFWYNYLSELNSRKIPTYLVSANFREEQFKGFYGKYLRQVLIFFDHIFVQNESSLKLLAKQKITNVTVSGDLRYDRVSKIASEPRKIEIIEHFKGENKLLICGSTWEKDEEIIQSAKSQVSSPKSQVPTIKIIIVPHEIHEAHIQKLISLFPESLRYSQISKEPVSSTMEKLRVTNVLIIDTIGILSSLYQYADIAYIGGGFGAGIHNILEAVVFGVPVIFGSNHYKFPEANELIEQGGGFCVSGANDFKKALDLLLSDEKILMMASMVCKNFVAQRIGAAGKIMSSVEKGFNP